MTILDRIAATHGHFRPKSQDDYFGLRLAEKLSDSTAAAHYAELMFQFGRDALLRAYLRAQKRNHTSHDLAKIFHAELPGGNGMMGVGSPGKLLALKIERRTIAAAAFEGAHLDFTEARELSSVPSKAESSTIGFLNWLCQVLAVESVTVETETHTEIRRAALRTVALQCLRDQGIAIREVPKSDLIASFAVPAPESRREMREIVCSIWPILEPDRPGILDSAALGLYVQTERYFE